MVSQEQKSIIFPIFTSSSPAPISGSFIWQPPLLFAAGGERCPFYTTTLRVPRTDDDVCGDCIRLCVRLYIRVHKFYIRTVVYRCVQILYTCLLFRRCFIRRLEPPRKIFTTVKTADVYCRPVSVLRPTEKGQHATDCHSRHTSGSGAKQP